MDKPFIKCTLNIQYIPFSLQSIWSLSNISIEALTLSNRITPLSFLPHSFSHRDFCSLLLVFSLFPFRFLAQSLLCRAMCRLNVVRPFRAHIVYRLFLVAMLLYAQVSRMAGHYRFHSRLLFHAFERKALPIALPCDY